MEPIEIGASVRPWKGRTAEQRRLWRRPENANRRARDLGLPGRIGCDDLRGLHESQGGRCCYCERPVDLHLPGGCELDHRVPLARGGSNEPENLQLLCPSCNRDKGALTPEHFAQSVQLRRRQMELAL